MQLTFDELADFAEELKEIESMTPEQVKAELLKSGITEEDIEKLRQRCLDLIEKYRREK